MVTADGGAMQATEFAIAERRTIASTVLATGVIRLRVGAEVRVGSQLSGIVEELNVTVGSKIQQGHVGAVVAVVGMGHAHIINNPWRRDSSRMRAMTS